MKMMTKKDYILIAEVLSGHIDLERNNLDSTAISIMEDLADMFKSENPRFSHVKFFEACNG